MTWFVQARCDDIVRNKEALPRLRKSGLNWVLMGVENSEPSTLDTFKKDITPGDAQEAVRLLKKNDIFRTCDANNRPEKGHGPIDTKTARICNRSGA